MNHEIYMPQRESKMKLIEEQQDLTLIDLFRHEKFLGVYEYQNYHKLLTPIMSFQTPKRLGLYNDAGECIDIYIPRKCNATSKLIHSRDRASVQINVGEVDEDGRYNGKNSVVTLCGYVRSKGQSDAWLEQLLREKKVYPYH